MFFVFSQEFLELFSLLRRNLWMLKVGTKNFTAPQNADGCFCYYLWKEMDLGFIIFPWFF